MDNKKLPIGYWIRQADHLLTNGIDKIQAGFGLTRTDWQILNTIAERSSVTKDGLLATMEPFVNASSAEIILEELRRKDLVSVEGDSLSLTKKGKSQHANCLERQKEFRQAAMNGITEKDYETTVQTLQAIVGNLNKADT